MDFDWRGLRDNLMSRTIIFILSGLNEDINRFYIK